MEFLVATYTSNGVISNGFVSERLLGQKKAQCVIWLSEDPRIADITETLFTM